MEAGGTGLQQAYDWVKQALYLETDRDTALRQAMLAVRKGGILSIPGVYDLRDNFTLGLLMNKGVTVRTAHQHGQAYVDRLLKHAQRGELTPAALAMHRFSLEDSPTGYRMFKHKEKGCLRAVFVP